MTIVMLTYNRLKYTLTALPRWIGEAEKAGFRVVVVDNGSTDGTGDYLRDFNLYNILLDKNVGISGAQVMAFEKYPDSWMMFVDNDVIPVTDGIAKKMQYVAEYMGERYILGAEMVNIDPTFRPSLVGYAKYGQHRLRLVTHVGGCRLFSAKACKEVLTIHKEIERGKVWRASGNYVAYTPWIEVNHIGEQDGCPQHEYKF